MNAPTPIIALRGYTRSGAFPIDATSVFYSYEDALEYAQESPIAYLGQIVAVVNETTKKVNVYKIDYYKLTADDIATRADVPSITLTELNTGNGTVSGVSFVNYKGRVFSYEELLEINEPNDHDMYYVQNDSDSGYAPYVFNNGEWTRIDLGIGMASAKSDGIISKELYRTFISTEQGVFYSDGSGNAENNKFIKLNTVGSSDTLQIMTADKVKSTIYSLIEADKPEVVIDLPRDISSMSIGDWVYGLTGKVIFYKKSAGNIISANIASSYFDTIELSSDDFTEIAPGIFESRECAFPSFKINDDDSQNYITSIVSYDANEETMSKEGQVIGRYLIKAYRTIQYRNSHWDQTDGEIFDKDYQDGEIIFALKDTEYTIKFIPGSEGMFAFYVKTPYELESVTYVQQNDSDFLGMMDMMHFQDTSNDFYQYSFTGYRDYPMTHPVTLKIKTKKD